MKVKALNHLRQQVGTMSVERVLNSVFELDEENAKKALEAGIIEILEDPKVSPKRDVAQNRKTK